MNNKQILNNYKEYFVRVALTFTEKYRGSCDWKNIRSEEDLAKYLHSVVNSKNMIWDFCTYTNELMLGCLALMFGEQYNWEINNIPVDILGDTYIERLERVKMFWDMLLETHRYEPSTYSDFILMMGGKLSLVNMSKHTWAVKVDNMLKMCDSTDQKEALSKIKRELYELQYEMSKLKSKLYDERP